MSQSESLRSAIDQTSTIIGIELNPASIRITDYPHVSYASMQDSSGLLDICVKGISQGRLGETDSLQTDPDAEDYLLNGLLRSEHGRIAVATEMADTPGIGQYVEVSVYSSPAGINEAHRQAGRIPGQDILEVVRPGNSGYHAPGPYIAAAKDRKILVANLVDWGITEHDLNPPDHPQSWYAMPPSVLTGISVKADELEHTYGDDLNQEQGVRPEAADRFAASLDDLAGFSRVMYGRLMHIDEPARLLDSPEDMVTSTVTIMPRYLRTFTAQNNYIERYSDVFKALGIIEPDVVETDYKVAALKTITALYMRHLASSLITLQALHPAETQNEEQTVQRIELWSKVIEWADQADPYPARHTLRIESPFT